MKDVLKDCEKRMLGALDAMLHELTTLRTGRASVTILDEVKVEYYGTPTPLSQVASLSVPDSQTIAIAPWETTLVGAIEKAIQKSNLGLNPSNDGKIIRLMIPALTEDRRKDLAKIARNYAEHCRNSVRQVRRDGNEKIKKLEKSKDISEDQMHDGQGEIQKLTDHYIGKVDEIVVAKEKEIMAV